MMEKLNIDQILRYLTVGFVVTGLAYICEPIQVSLLIKTLGAIGFPIAAFTIGTLVYLSYRSTVYTFLINPLKDRISTANYRVKLMTQYNLESSFKAEVLWYTVRDLYIDAEHQKKIHFHSSGIHLLYLSAVSFFIAAIYALASGEKAKAFYISIGLIIFGIAGLLSDIAVEKQEYFLLINTDQSKIEVIANKIKEQTNTQQSHKL